MKRSVYIFFSFVLIVSAQNLIQNPGFEAWSGGLPDNWEKDDSIFVYQEDVIVHTGNFSVRDSLITQAQATADLYQERFIVLENTQYDFSFWVYDNDQAGRVRHGVYWYPSGSEWCPDYSVDLTTWQQLSFTTTSPSGTDSALVLIRAYDIEAQWDGDAIFYLDDVYFAPPAIQPPVINRIWHTPVNPGPGTTVDVYANVVDDGNIVADTLFYGINNLITPVIISHTSISNDTFLYHVPGQSADDTVFYYLKFLDNDGLSVISDTHSFFTGVMSIKINEIFYDTQGSDSACFVELHGPGNTNLDNISLVGVNGYNGSDYVTVDLTGYTIPNDGFFVIAQDSGVNNYDLVTNDADMQNGPDNLELRLNDIPIDGLGYGTLNGWFFTGEWLPALDVEYDHCLGRYPDGQDTDNNSVDFHDYTTFTPGEPNPPVSMCENRRSLVNMPAITNPVRSGILFSSLIEEPEAYPITVYNSLGQAITEVIIPRTPCHFPCGVYFLKTNYGPQYNCLKVVVVK
ncbi:MAG: hypothetical protein WBB37_10865 [bacterium]